MVRHSKPTVPFANLNGLVNVPVSSLNRRYKVLTDKVPARAAAWRAPRPGLNRKSGGWQGRVVFAYYLNSTVR